MTDGALALEILRLIDAAPESMRRLIILENPALFDPIVHKAIGASARALNNAEKDVVLRAIRHVREEDERLRENLYRYPIELGPLSDVVKRIQSGELTEESASALCRSHEIVGAVSPLYLAAVGAQCSETAGRGQWRDVTMLHRLVLATARTMIESGRHEPELDTARIEWITVAQSALAEVPDDFIYNETLDLADTLVAEAERTGNRNLAAKTKHRMGGLLLDTYTYQKIPEHARENIKIRRHQSHVDYGANEAAARTVLRLLPDPKEGLRLARTYLSEARQVGTGVDLGYTCKTLCFCLIWLQRQGDPIEEAEIESAAEQALSLIPHDSDPSAHVALNAALNRPRSKTLAAPHVQFPPLSVASYLEMHGPGETINEVTRRLAFLNEADPAAGLSLLKEASSLYREHADEPTRIFRYRREIKLLIAAYQPQSRETRDPATRDDHPTHEGSPSPWAASTEKALFARGLAAVCASSATNSELSAIATLQELRLQHGSLAVEHSESLSFLEAGLWSGEGANHYKVGHDATAMPCYLRSLELLLALRLRTHSLDALDRLIDTVRLCDLVEPVLTTFTPLIPKIEEFLAEEGVAKVQTIGRSVLARCGPRLNVPMVLLVMQAFKGARFARSLRRGVSYSTRNDETAQGMLKTIATAAAAARDAPDRDIRKGYSVLDQELLLATRIGKTEQLHGLSATQRLINLQRSFDEYVDNQVCAPDIGAGLSIDIDMESLQQSIGDRTVLVLAFAGCSESRRVRLWIPLITRESIQLHVTTWTRLDVPTTFLRQGTAVTTTTVGLFTRSTRQALNGTPWMGHVGLRARRLLRRAADDLLGPALMRSLSSLRRAGKDHLCIVPHGSLHYMPYHLLGTYDHPLSGEWVVTYLPTIELLQRSSITRERKPVRRRMAALGLGFENASNAAPIPQARDSVKAIASKFGVEAILDESVTKATFLEALRTSRYVHLSTHGVHNAVAPAFQSVQLSPDAFTDERFCAHELLGEDLDGLDVVTMAACETSLGRFDQSDNLRGIVAGLFFGGASTVIGTLWPAEMFSTNIFFETFYERIAAGDSKLDAFSVAQRETRRRHPHYRDWGAFQYSGLW